MGSFPLYGEKIWYNWSSSWLFSYSKNTSQLQQKHESALGLNLALILRCGAHRLASVLERGAHRLALKLKREAFQACICVEMRSYTRSHFNVETWPWGLCLKEHHDHRVWQRLRDSRLRLEGDLCIGQKDARFAFGLRCDPRVWHEACVWGWDANSASARFASEVLSSVIFRQPTRTKEELLTISSELKEDLQHSSIASPSLWITTRIATYYRGSIEYLALSILKFWNFVFFYVGLISISSSHKMSYLSVSPNRTHRDCKQKEFTKKSIPKKFPEALSSTPRGGLPTPFQPPRWP